MAKSKLVSNVNIRLNLEDMNLLRNEAEKRRVPVSTYCRSKLIQSLYPI
jgi:predicted DNA binding CopG/RHH family protein